MATFLRRYTDALSLIDILNNKRLSLLSPAHWYDQNDAFGLELYRKRVGAARVYALCFTDAAETGHHWQLFAGQNHGVCIMFDHSALRAHLDDFLQVLHGPVEYLNLSRLAARSPIPDERLPFLKRETFAAEQEYRIVATEEAFFAADTYSIPLPLHLIKRITLGPGMSRGIAETLKDLLCKQDGCADIPFAHSKLVNNARWQEEILKGSRISKRPI